MTTNGPGYSRFRQEFVDAIRLLIHDLPEPNEGILSIPEAHLFDNLKVADSSKTTQASILLIFHKCHCPHTVPEVRRTKSISKGGKDFLRELGGLM